MICNRTPPIPIGSGNTQRARRAFSLIELLTVIFIISLLIGILIPSINSARNAAKKATTSKAIESIRVGLEMFKNDNGRDFRQTNGYPPSFAHPKIPGYTFQPYLGEFPFLPEAAQANPKVYGAHWLPAMLMGVDNMGYVQRSSVPNENNLRKSPWLWYAPDPLGAGKPLDQRAPLYIDPGGIRTKATKDLPGRENRNLFPDWATGTDFMRVRDLPVIVDAFDQPILYYVASTHGRVTNMVEDKRDPTNTNTYVGNDQENGVPFYFHEDNVGFTGDAAANQAGWDFGVGGKDKDHIIADSGELLTAATLVLPANRNTFARYIIDRNIWSSLPDSPASTLPLRPVNADTYLLISPGPDGLYGTNDDVTNLPAWPD